jgi:hypothetical protein
VAALKAAVRQLNIVEFAGATKGATDVHRTGARSSKASRQDRTNNLYGARFGGGLCARETGHDVPKWRASSGRSMKGNNRHGIATPRNSRSQTQ